VKDEPFDYIGVFNSLEESVLLIDAEYRIREINAAFCRSYGVTRAETVGRTCFSVTHGLDRPCWQSGEDCPVKKLLEGGGRSHRVLHRHQPAGQSERWEEICATACRDRADVPYVIEEIRDVTETFRMREELSSLQPEIKRLEGLLPICASCHKIRDEKGDWQRLENYVSGHSEAQFTHSICPDCLRKEYPDFT
jgi:PAS domain S-box-containing protein